MSEYKKPQEILLLNNLDDLINSLLDRIFPLEKIIEDTNKNYKQKIYTVSDLIIFYENSMDELIVNAYTFNECERNFYISLLFIQNTLINEKLIQISENKLKDMLLCH